MSNTKAGGQSLRETMIGKHGSEEAWKAVMRKYAAKGGRNGHTGGFYANRELASTAGKKGGEISRRGPKL